MARRQQKFFHTLDTDGQIDKQGMVLSQTSSQVTVEFFSWLDGLPNGKQTFGQDETMTWHFYESKAEWQNAGDKVFL